MSNEYGARYGTCNPTGDAERDKRRMRDVIAATKAHRQEAKEHLRRILGKAAK